MGPLRGLSGRPGGCFSAPRARQNEIKQRNQKCTFRRRKTYNSQGLVGALGRLRAHLGNFLAKMAPIFNMIVSPSTSWRNLSRLKPLLDPPFCPQGRPQDRKKKNETPLGALLGASGAVLGQKGGVGPGLAWNGKSDHGWKPWLPACGVLGVFLDATVVLPARGCPRRLWKPAKKTQLWTQEVDNFCVHDCFW